ncbi:cupin domain-containing protein [Halomonas halocynthiae]|uniref:cupin domain-containing protein n=1 Tax=Halomonas halocynthiae TaxID=176290 RepID=UPI00042522AE|nr:cupin domain-containing protein [Halomonas halocynthiae]
MIRCVRLWTGENGDSLFEEGTIEFTQGERGDQASQAIPATRLSFRETAPGGAWGWHQDPEPRYVITLSGTLEFETKSGATFIIKPGDILLAQDNRGSGHKWRLLDDEPWRRAYIVYEDASNISFKANCVEAKVNE